MLCLSFVMNFPDGHAKRAAGKISLPYSGYGRNTDSSQGIHCSLILPTMGGW
jgi:hypothetical protein